MTNIYIGIIIYVVAALGCIMFIIIVSFMSFFWKKFKLQSLSENHMISEIGSSIDNDNKTENAVELANANEGDISNKNIHVIKKSVSIESLFDSKKEMPEIQDDVKTDEGFNVTGNEPGDV